MRARIVRVDGGVDAHPIAVAYLAEREMIVRTRLEITVALWFFFVGAVTLIERSYFPTRASTMTTHFLIDGAVCLAMVLLGRLGIAALPPTRLATILTSFLIVRATTYLVAVGETAELLALAHVTVLCGLMVLLPWGWVCQLVVVLISLGSVAWGLPHLTLSRVWFYSLVPLVTTAMTTVLGAFLLERFRREHFVRDAEQTERAETASILGTATDALGNQLEQGELIERANHLALETLGSDWTGTWLCDDEHRTLELAAAAGVRAHLRAELAALALPWSYRSMLEDVTADAVVEVPSAAEQALVSSDVLRRFEITSALLVPLWDGGDLLGCHLHAYRYRSGPFSARQRSLAVGIAHRTAAGLKNARVIGELQALSRLKSDFLSTMSHELRTPVNIIAGYTELLADGAFGPLMPAQQETVARVRRKILEMLELVGATLDIGKVESGREVVSVETVDLDKLFGDLDVELEPLVSASTMLRWRRDLGRPTVHTDGAKLKIILKNLVGNALKFTVSGSVDVTAQRTARTIRFAVRDTGSGIAVADIGVIFEKFRQLDGAPRRQGGVGLGLYIVRRLVDLMDGSITVESTLGAGSTFTVELPIQEPA